MTPQRVLISGAGIAGMGLAHWLARSNHDITLIDRFESFHARGHFMTLKGTCVEILSAMGLSPEKTESALAELRAKGFQPRT